jgi:chromosome condensin MukBEF ATPase and DNA-binding subunit MukB
MIWNVYAELKDMKAKRAEDRLEYRKLRSDYDSQVHNSGRDSRAARDREQRILDRSHRESQTLKARIADLEKALDLKATLALTAQIRIEQLERAALGGMIRPKTSFPPKPTR